MTTLRVRRSERPAPAPANLARHLETRRIRTEADSAEKPGQITGAAAGVIEMSGSRPGVARRWAGGTEAVLIGKIGAVVETATSSAGVGLGPNRGRLADEGDRPEVVMLVLVETVSGTRRSGLVWTVCFRIF